MDMLLRKVDQLQTNLSEAQKQQASTKADMHGCMVSVVLHRLVQYHDLCFLFCALHRFQ